MEPSLRPTRSSPNAYARSAANGIHGKAQRPEKYYRGPVNSVVPMRHWVGAFRPGSSGVLLDRDDERERRIAEVIALGW